MPEITLKTKRELINSTESLPSLLMVHWTPKNYSVRFHKMKTEALPTLDKNCGKVIRQQMISWDTWIQDMYPIISAPCPFCTSLQIQQSQGFLAILVGIQEVAKVCS